MDEKKRKRKAKYSKVEHKKKKKRRYSTSSSDDVSSTSPDSSSDDNFRRKEEKSRCSRTEKSRRIKKKKKDKDKISRHRYEKEKIEKKKKKKSSKHRKRSKEEKAESGNKEVPLPVKNLKTDEQDIGPTLATKETSKEKRSMAPMTKEEYEKQQSVMRHVFDPDTGRYRLIKGDGEIMEECVSYSRHKEINKQATRGDGATFQRMLGLS